MLKMASKPLSYPSQCSILAHMGADSRILFSATCPQIEKLEKSLPLKIANLTLNPLELQINATKFEIDFVRRNELAKDLKLEPISNDFEKLYFSENLHEKENRLEKQLKTWETILANEQEIEKLHWLDEILRTSEELLKVRSCLGMIRPMNYKNYLEFLIQNSESRKSVLLEHNKPANSAIEHVLRKIFGGRESIIVDNMDIRLKNMEITKFERKLDGLEVSSTAEGIFKSLISSAKFVINHLHANSEDLEIENPIFQNIHHIKIYGKEWCGSIWKLRPKIVHFAGKIHQFMWCLKEWNVLKLGTGTRWSCKFKRRALDDVKFNFDRLPHELREHEFDVEIQENAGRRGSPFNRRIVVSIDEQSESLIYCTRNSQSSATYGTMVFEVVSSGN